VEINYYLTCGDDREGGRRKHPCSQILNKEESDWGPLTGPVIYRYSIYNILINIIYNNKNNIKYIIYYFLLLLFF
jgi:hypothetical protein